MNINGFQSSQEFREVQQIWKGSSSHTEADLRTSQPFINFNLKSILNQSPCVTWIMDIRTQTYTFISDNTLEHFGYLADNYVEKGQDFQDEIKHPEDRTSTGKLRCQIWQMLSTISPASKMNYRFSYDYRIVKPDGKVLRILEQNSVLQQDANGNITHLLGVCNDITQWKKNGPQLASLSSAIDKQYFLFTTDNSIKPKTLLSKRELEIVKLISEGHSSKFIADKLFISFHTVNTHRQKMIEKTNTRNTGGLVQFAICNGLI
jgi:DNA-binding CsgD family transcriptional regulator